MASYTFKPVTISHRQAENEHATETLKRWHDTALAEETREYLPPGMTRQTWATVVKKFQAALGTEKVVLGDELRVLYADPFSMNVDEKERRGTACALRPTTVEEIQAILKIANEYKIPLWTVSRGKNLGYGGPVGRVKVWMNFHFSPSRSVVDADFSLSQGSVVVDLQNMNKILDINDKYSYYTVEPGVSFFQLFQTIQEQKKKIWCSTPALGWGSVVGNALDRVCNATNVE